MWIRCRNWAATWTHVANYAAKAAVTNLKCSIACDYGHDGVCAYKVCPGLIKTHDDQGEHGVEALLAKSLSSILLRCAGTLDRGGDAINFLASDQAVFITGATLAIYG